MDLLSWAEQRTLDLSSRLGPLPPPEVWWSLAGEARDLAFDLHSKQTRFCTKLPYAVHLIDTALLSFAAFQADSRTGDLQSLLAVAWLHDSIEDQNTDESEILRVTTSTALASIRALTKNPGLPKSEAMADSILRISQDPAFSAQVKLADRASNLLDPPPAKWSFAKIAAYRHESEQILDSLGAASPFLAQILSKTIRLYGPNLSESSPRLTPSRAHP